MRVYSLVKIVDKKTKIIMAYEELIKQQNVRLNELENEKTKLEKQVNQLKRENNELKERIQNYSAENINSKNDTNLIKLIRKRETNNEGAYPITYKVGTKLYSNNFNIEKGKLVIPEGYTEIQTRGLMPFAHMLRHLVIPKSMKKIDWEALTCCKNLVKVEVEETNSVFCVIDNVLCNMEDCVQVWRPPHANASEVIDRKLKDYLQKKTNKK